MIYEIEDIQFNAMKRDPSGYTEEEGSRIDELLLLFRKHKLDVIDQIEEIRERYSS